MKFKKRPKPPVFYDLRRDGVTQSLLNEFLMCPQRARLGYVMGLTPITTSGALSFGSVVHDALDKIYSEMKMRLSTETNPTLDWLPTFLKEIISSNEAVDRKVLNT